MKDLKHLAFFEDLLQDSGNGLVEQSRISPISLCSMLIRP